MRAFRTGVGKGREAVASGRAISGQRRRAWAVVMICGLSCGGVLSCSNPNYTIEGCSMKAAASGTESDVRTDTDLRVMTLNMWGIRFVSSDIDARFEALAQRLQADDSIDVVGLQELWADGPRRRLLRAVAEAFPHQVDFQGQYGRSGLAILSRLPFAGSPRFIPFPKTGKWWKPWTGEWLGGKGIGAVEIQAAAGPVWFFVTHLHACYAPGEPSACENGDEYAHYRSHQLQTLRATVNDIAGERPALIAGDFNFTTQSKYYQDLTSNGADQSERHDPPWMRIEENEAPAARIDHLWIRPGKNGSWRAVRPAQMLFTEPVILPGGRSVPLSDHCAIAATVQPTD